MLSFSVFEIAIWGVGLSQTNHRHRPRWFENHAAAFGRGQQSVNNFCVQMRELQEMHKKFHDHDVNLTSKLRNPATWELELGKSFLLPISDDTPFDRALYAHSRNGIILFDCNWMRTKLEKFESKVCRQNLKSTDVQISRARSTINQACAWYHGHCENEYSMFYRMIFKFMINRI